MGNNLFGFIKFNIFYSFFDKNHETCGFIGLSRLIVAALVKGGAESFSRRKAVGL
jgi:hypothetical protein